MAAKDRKEGLYDLSNVVAFGHNEQWLPKGAAKVSTKLAAKISPNGNTGRQLDPAAAALALPARCCVRGVPAAHLQKRGCHKRTGIGG